MTDQQLLQIARAVASIVETISEAVGAEPETPTEQPQWPQPGDLYWYINSWGKVGYCTYRGGGSDLARDTSHNLFRSKELAQEELMRQKSMRPTFVPEPSQIVWVVTLDDLIQSVLWSPDCRRTFAALCTLCRLGRIHPNEESARAWRKLYGDLWSQEPGNA